MNKFAIALFLILANISLLSAEEEPLFNGFGDSKKYEKVLVEKVMSADYFLLSTGEQIKLIGIKAPSPPRRKEIEVDENHIVVRKEDDPNETIEEKAIHFAKELLEDHYIRLEFDNEKKDSAFRTLAYAFLPDGTFVNAEIVRQGFANLNISPPNTKYNEELRKAYQEARHEKRGLQGE